MLFLFLWQVCYSCFSGRYVILVSVLSSLYQSVLIGYVDCGHLLWLQLLDGQFAKEVSHETDGLIFQPVNEVYITNHVIMQITLTTSLNI